MIMPAIDPEFIASAFKLMENHKRLVKENRALREQRDALAAALADLVDATECECAVMPDGHQCRACVGRAALRAIAPEKQTTA